MSIERGSSIIEIGAVRPPADRYDVAILGGGLAGLTLAIQLKRTRPETSVVVLEKRESRSRPQNGIVVFLHTAYNQRDELIASCKRSALMYRLPAGR